MLRKERVYACLKEQYDKAKQRDKRIEEGFSAEYIALKLKLARNNVSSDLNKLFREGRVDKIEGHPTLYIPRENISHSKISRKHNEDKDKSVIHEDCFRDLIGFNGSLSTHIRQAQAAILYPPRGLSTILIGETGTGKTTFADHMYRFAIDNNIIKKQAPYVVFNCADYANNPQLLMAILFGSARGAYTGSDVDREGLVEKANKGVLFLDEVHRLPHEGQEMLFNIIDRGRFRRLGEVVERESEILIIAATTQDRKSVLLDTFLRRFSIVIRLPSLRERGIKERLEIIASFFNREAIRIKRPIKVSRDVISALLLNPFEGNVGELKSTIELICSRGYLEYLINHKDICITLTNLPDNLKNALMINSSDKIEINKLIGFEDMVFCGERFDSLDIGKDPYDFSREVYSYLDKKSSEYANLGIPKSIIVEKLSLDLEEALFRYSKGLISFGLKVSELSKFLDEKIISSVRQLSEEVLIKYNYNIKENTKVALAFHINSMIDRKKSINGIDISEIKDKYPMEFMVASYIIERLKNILKCKIAEDEKGFISMILHLTAKEETIEKRIGIIVIAHGESTASSMAQVVNRLLRTDIVKAIDMKLEDSPGDVLNQTIELARKVDAGKGILLFVDMGSLKTFGDEIEKATGIKTITIDNLNTPSLLEAAHKSMLPYFELRDIALSVLELNKTIINTTLNEISGLVFREGVIFTICSTGEGTAVYLKDVIERVLNKNKIDGIQVIEINATDIKSAVEKMRRLAGEREIIAVVGSINPQYPGVQFIDLLECVTGNGLERIIHLITKDKTVKIETSSENRRIVYGAICDALDENLHFLSGKKLMPYIDKYIEEFEEETGVKLDNHNYILLCMHLAYAIERLKFNGQYEKNIPMYKTKIIPKIYRDFGVLLDEDETGLIDRIMEQSI